MRNRGCSHAIRRVTALECAHQSTAAPGVRALHQRTSEVDKILDLQSETTQRIPRQRVKPGGDQDQIGNEAGGGGIYTSLERIDVLLAVATGRHRDVPDCLMRAAVVGGTGSGIPRPLMHRDEVDVGLIFHERLSAVAMMDVPIDDENSL